MGGMSGEDREGKRGYLKPQLASLARRGWLRLNIDGEDMSGRNLSLIHEVRLA